MEHAKISLVNTRGRNDRFSYAKVYKDGRWLFVKTAKSPELEQNLQREQLWADFVNYVGTMEPAVGIRGPEIIGFDENGGLMMEYIEAPLAAEPSDGAAWKAKINRYARVLSALDAHAPGYNVAWPAQAGASIDEIDTIWKRWFGERYVEALPVLDTARPLIQRAAMTYCVQHGDLTPWQIFEKGEEWIIYDGEKAGDHLHRYNDLAYGYGRLFTRLKDPRTAATLLEKFIVYSGVNRGEFFTQFLPIMTFRATGMLADAYADSTHENYIQQARELLELCFTGKLEDFLQEAHEDTV